VTAVQFQIGGTLRFLVEEEGYALVTVRYRDFSVTAKGDKMAYTMTIDQGVHVQVAYVDSHGNPAKVDGVVTWASSDQTIASVVVDGTDSTKAAVAAGGKLGQAQVTATADADLGSGVRELITPMDVTIVAGEAVSGTITPVGDAFPLPPP